MNIPTTGIHDLSVATTRYSLDHQTLAEGLGLDPEKFTIGIGQNQMSLPATDEDVVTMAAAAGAPIIERHGVDDIRTVVFATETGVDESKAAGLFLHRLIGLPSTARVVELKQACYVGTAALQFARGLVSADPGQRVLVIASDIAQYDLDAPAEATQGAAAVAMLVTADPAILRVDSASGLYSDDVMDFWRPNYRSTPVVDGEYSIDAYLTAVEHAWNDYRKQTGRDFTEFAGFCYHQPFTKMAHKAHRHMLERTGQRVTSEKVDDGIGATLSYNRAIGNSYTASVYVALASLLDNAADLTDEPIALISYGSGCVAEFLSATVISGYRDHLRTTATRRAIAARSPIDYDFYRTLHQSRSAISRGGAVPDSSSGPYGFAGVRDHKRIYEVRRPSPFSQEVSQ